MNFKIEKRNSIKTAGYVFKTGMTEVGSENNPIGDFWQSVFDGERVGNLRNIQKRCGDYGICVMTGENDMDYIIAVEIADETQVDEGIPAFAGMTVCEIPAGEYLVIETPLDKVVEAWAQSFQCLEGSGYEMSGEISYEYYDARMGQDPQLIDIVIPVVGATAPVAH
ncbi:MAG: effector binding domain-containing protein [Clostridiales bacterium]|jgi:predicted transcriptional regulator YdeE|nr:effector binding domain-containing protein [Clostridiales bacterium]